MGYAMPADAALHLLDVLAAYDVRPCVGGGWGVDALIGEQTRPHSDLDLWIPTTETEGLFVAFVAEGIDRIFPWPDDRPWNFVLHDADTRRVDLHFYERGPGGRLQYGSAVDPFVFSEADLSGHGVIAGVEVRCQRPEFALRCHTGYQPRDIDRADVAALCPRFALAVPDEYRQRCES
jgi:lincosamide nucleotidyltransferase A/C/D/E